MAAGIGSMNWWYVRHDPAGVVSTTQPGFTTSSWEDPGFGWSKWRYQNQNGDYIRQSGIVSAYVRHDENNQPVGVISAYRRYDMDNVAFSTAGPNIPNTGP